MEGYLKRRLRRAKGIILLSQKYTSFSGKRVLDVGCGKGPLSYLLYKKGPEVHAIDISDEFLKEMKEFTKGMKIDIKKAPNENLPFSNNFFNLIFSFDVIEHLRDYEKSFAEMNRCLKKGGYVFLEMTPYYALATGHHLYYFTFLPVQYLPRKLMKWWILRKQPIQSDMPNNTPEQAWDQFISLNKIYIAKLRQLAPKNNFEILEENFIFKIPGLFETKINWIRHFGFLKEMIPMAYQAVFKKT